MGEQAGAVAGGMCGRRLLRYLRHVEIVLKKPVGSQPPNGETYKLDQTSSSSGGVRSNAEQIARTWSLPDPRSNAHILTNVLILFPPQLPTDSSTSLSLWRGRRLFSRSVATTKGRRAMRRWRGWIDEVLRCSKTVAHLKQTACMQWSPSLHRLKEDCTFEQLTEHAQSRVLYW